MKQQIAELIYAKTELTVDQEEQVHAATDAIAALYDERDQDLRDTLDAGIAAIKAKRLDRAS